MSENKYPNSGRMFTNGYKNPGTKAPDHKGMILMERSVLKKLLQDTDADDIEIKLSAWDMQGAKGPWLRLAWDNFVPSGNAARSAPVQQQNSSHIDDEDIPF